ncbi:diaminopimelate epimerase [Methylococcus capsulatus]|jgi:diaminopimelate epimerase|uniref:Diaminopimelate epimerase n=1 Tax=Methylococcus capsulatus (strain ATCC 33009 / NCIMB 11132 / Bath) TaxID=243233 RepID=Q60AJ4_METCA|nr:diaminopimelate epimerase [Methylococcus capsulatus str. Bath]QXP94615.1 diaminopimelate epimerase [Methylococcus capsulatus]
MLRFTKMQGLGNDFVVIDAIHQTVNLDEAALRRLADRHYGIGCDQILLVEPPASDEVDFRYRIFNADGGEVSQCGNGARCFARFVREKGLIDRDEIRVETAAGRMVLWLEAGGEVRVEMGVPRHAPAEVPLLADRERSVYTVNVEGVDWQFGAVSVGNPHAVITVADVDEAPVARVGTVLERHELFPERANIGFMQVLDLHHARLRVYERGTGETLACGSGACAAAVVGILQGTLESPVRIDLPGGTLRIGWQGRGTPVYLSGPAVTVFEGRMAT